MCTIELFGGDSRKNIQCSQKCAIIERKQTSSIKIDQNLVQEKLDVEEQQYETNDITYEADNIKNIFNNGLEEDKRNDEVNFDFFIM